MWLDYIENESALLYVKFDYCLCAVHIRTRLSNVFITLRLCLSIQWAVQMSIEMLLWWIVKYWDQKSFY